MNEYIVDETEAVAGFTGKIMFDPEPMNPRTEYDGHLATLLCAHSRYDLGDEQISSGDRDTIVNRLIEEEGVTICCLHCGKDIEDDGYGSWYHADDEADEPDDKCSNGEEIEPKVEGVVTLPLYLYDHSGISMSTGAFSCPWDSGQVGIGFTSLVKLRENWPGVSDDELMVKGRENIEAEVNEYDAYLTGMVYGYVVEDEDDDTLDSCWGFYDEDECKSQMQAALDWHIKNHNKPVLFADF